MTDDSSASEDVKARGTSARDTERRDFADLLAETFGGNEETEDLIREKARDLGLDVEIEVEE